MITLRYIHGFRTRVLWGLVLLSILLTIYDMFWGRQLQGHAQEAGVLGLALIGTEGCFIVGAILMVVSAGESFASVKPRHWLRHLSYLRREIRIITARLLKNRLFGLGFWLNFFGAVGTSLIFILGVVLFVPEAGWGVLIVIVLDLVATFGWRVPLHLERRKTIKDKI